MISLNVFSQDINFTMFNFSPLTLNPANTANFNGDWRIAGNLRNQWPATSNPYRTATLSFDTKFNISKHKFGAGLLFINDESGASRLNYNKVFVTLGFEKEISKNYFNIGVQFGYVFGSINDWTTWNNQTRSENTSSGEPYFGAKASYADLNAGFSWRKNIGKIEPEAGFSFFHINTPNYSFVQSDNEEKLKFIFHSKVKVKFEDKIYLLPALLCMRKDNRYLTILGTNIGYNFVGNMSRVKQIFGGFYFRNGIIDEIDSYSVLLGSTIGRLDIAFSYDLLVSSLKGSTGNMGGYEISLIYRSFSTLLNTYSIPCERF
jgi:type IX secretion system PorP/SprF family membrane protein